MNDPSKKDPETKEPSPESRVGVRITDDRLSAFVSIARGPAGDEAHLRCALEGAGLRAGIDERVVTRLGLGLNDDRFEIARELVASGTRALEGEDGRFELAFLAGIQPGHLREDGTIDFHDRELLKPVLKGEVLGQVHPARAGVQGQLVDGTTTSPAKPREATLVLGSGAERDADGVVRAAHAGVVVWKPPRSIDVVEQHVHEGSVDLRSGDLHMQGSLLVKGDVHRSFGVYATGDLEIRGAVDGGNVHSGGSVKIKQGVRGGDAATVCAEGDLAVHHAESAVLYAGRLLQIGDAVHSRLAAGRIEVSGKVRGGVTQAEFSIILREVGSSLGTDTELVAAEPLELPIESAQRALERAKALRFARSGVGPRHEHPIDRGKGGKIGRVQASLQEAEVERLAQRALRRQTLSAVAFIQVGIAHPGVTLRIGSHKLAIETEMRAVRILVDGETSELRAEKARP